MSMISDATYHLTQEFKIYSRFIPKLQVHAQLQVLVLNMHNECALEIYTACDVLEVYSVRIRSAHCNCTAHDYPHHHLSLLVAGNRLLCFLVLDSNLVDACVGYVRDYSSCRILFLTAGLCLVQSKKKVLHQDGRSQLLLLGRYLACYDLQLSVAVIAGQIA